MESSLSTHYLSNSHLGPPPDMERCVTTARQPLDPAYLTDIFEAGGEPLVREVVATFLEDAPRRLQAVFDAVGAEDWAAAALAAHTIVSGSSMLGLTGVAAAARHVEHVTLEHRRPSATELDALRGGLVEARAVLTESADLLASGAQLEP